MPRSVLGKIASAIKKKSGVHEFEYSRRRGVLSYNELAGAEDYSIDYTVRKNRVNPKSVSVTVRLSQWVVFDDEEDAAKGIDELKNTNPAAECQFDVDGELVSVDCFATILSGELDNIDDYEKFVDDLVVDTWHKSLKNWEKSYGQKGIGKYDIPQ